MGGVHSDEAEVKPTIMKDVHAKIDITYYEGGTMKARWRECSGHKFYRLGKEGDVYEAPGMDEVVITGPFTLVDFGEEVRVDKGTFTKRELMEEIRAHDQIARMYSDWHDGPDLHNICFDGLSKEGDVYTVHWSYF